MSMPVILITPAYVHLKTVPMDSRIKESILFALCGLDVPFPRLPLHFEGLVAKHNKLAAICDYNLNMRLSDLYKRVAFSRHTSLEEVYLMYEKELERIERWYAQCFVFGTAATEHNECVLNAAAKRFIETGSTIDSELVASEQITEFDMCEWNNRFSLKQLYGTEAGELILSCGKMAYFEEIMLRACPQHVFIHRREEKDFVDAHICNIQKNQKQRKSQYYEDCSRKKLHEEAPYHSKSISHTKNCEDPEHRFTKVGFLSRVHYLLCQDFNKKLFPLVSNEVHKIYEFVFLRNCSQIIDFIIIFDRTGEISDYPFKLKFGKHTLKGQIFKILNRDLAETATLIELVTIDINSILQHFLSKKTLNELELIFRYLFALTYLQYYLRKTNKRVLLSIIMQLTNSYQATLFPAKSTTVEECLLNLDMQIKKALGIFGMTESTILENLKFIDVVMGYIFGSKELSEVLMLARQVDFQGVLHSVDWNMLSMHDSGNL
eukprot:jgi/Antlo1/1373/1216